MNLEAERECVRDLYRECVRVMQAWTDGRSSDEVTVLMGRLSVAVQRVGAAFEFEGMDQ